MRVSITFLLLLIDVMSTFHPIQIEPGKVYSVGSAALALATTPEVVQGWIDEGSLRHFSGGHVLIHGQWIIDMVLDNGTRCDSKMVSPAPVAPVAKPVAKPDPKSYSPIVNKKAKEVFLEKPLEDAEYQILYGPNRGPAVEGHLSFREAESKLIDKVLLDREQQKLIDKDWVRVLDLCEDDPAKPSQSLRQKSDLLRKTTYKFFPDYVQKRVSQNRPVIIEALAYVLHNLRYCRGCVEEMPKCTCGYMDEKLNKNGILKTL